MKLKLIYYLSFILLSFNSFADKYSVPENNFSVIKTDTLHIMISKKNHFYYYENSMLIDGSNFMVTNVNGAKNQITMFLVNSKEKEHQSIILLKIIKRTALNKDSKRVIDYIKQQNYKKSKLNKEEKFLIKKTEEAEESFFEKLHG